MKIGNVIIDTRVFLAPLAGVTDLPFRVLCRQLGARMACTEMISAKGLCYGSANTAALLQTADTERPIGVQLFGREPELLAKAAQMIAHMPFALIDINMGCPAPKIFNNGEGAALMKEPKRAGEIVKAVCRAAQKPVTVKIRKGVDENSVNAAEIARIAEQNGAAAVTVHGRVRTAYYSGAADWDAIAHVVESVKIPVIANGDVTGPAQARALLDHTGAAAVMIGRGAMGNPWILRRCHYFLETGELLPEPTTDERFAAARRHCQMLADYKGPYMGIREMRKHAAWYTKGLPNSAKLRLKINQAETIAEMFEILTPNRSGQIAAAFKSTD